LQPKVPTSTPPLRIVHVVDSLEFGGLERVVADLARAQLAAGHQVSVFSLNDTGGLKGELRQAGIPVVEGHKRAGPDLGVLKALRRCARAVEADVVHAHNFVPNYHAAAALLGLGRPPVLVCTCHDMGMRLSNRKLRTLFAMSLTRTAKVAMVGQQVYDQYLRTGLVKKDQVVMVRNGIPLERFALTPERRASARAALGLAAGDRVVGCVGRLAALKNHARMIDVMPALLREHPGLKLVIVGEGPMQDALETQVRQLGLGDNVMLAGQRSDVADLLPAFDVFALPSQTEGLSIALLEACATSLAVVATRVGGNPEIISDGQTGLLIPVDDNAALHQAVGRLLGDEALRQRLGAAACRWVAEQASVNAVRIAYETSYREALAAV
jgi:glycosyltransferase involved in cell wall biosynthesis